jgi:hypothetical protein
LALAHGRRAVVAFGEEAVSELRAKIMRAIPSHPVLHVVVSYAASALQQHYPWLRRVVHMQRGALDRTT